MTSSCGVQGRSRSLPLPLDTATNWLNVEAFMVRKPTAPDATLSDPSLQSQCYTVLSFPHNKL